MLALRNSRMPRATPMVALWYLAGALLLRNGCVRLCAPVWKRGSIGGEKEESVKGTIRRRQLMWLFASLRVRQGTAGGSARAGASDCNSFR